MEKHTQKGLKEVWSGKMAQSRAKRAASSAPRGLELKNYERLLKKVLKGKKSPWVLVLGATPELRDLALKLGATTLAVDISQDMLESMTVIMKYKDDPKNLMAKTDWLKIGKIFQPATFNVVLADVSLNQVPPEKHDQVLKNVFLLLKPGGFFITRNFIYLPNKPKDSFTEVQKKYNQGKLDWIWVTIHISQYTKWQPLIYNLQTKKLIYGRLLDLLFDSMRRKKFKMKKPDLEKLKNLRFHSRKITHISFPEKEWEKLIKKYFIIKDRVGIKKWEWTEYGPIWVLKKK